MGIIRNMFEFDSRMSPDADISDARYPSAVSAEPRTEEESISFTIKKLAGDFTRAIFTVAANCYHIGLKFAQIVQAVYFVAGNIIPLALTAVVAQAVGAGKFAESVLMKAHDIANNNIRIASMAAVLEDVLSSLPSMRPLIAFRTILRVPLLAGIGLGTAATVWSEQVNRGLYKVGRFLGLTKVDPVTENAIANAAPAEFDGSGVAQVVGALAATTAAAAVAPTVSSVLAPVTWCFGRTAMVTRPIVAALGAKAGENAWQMFTSSASQTGSDVAHGLQEQSPQPSPRGPADLTGGQVTTETQPPVTEETQYTRPAASMGS